MINSIKIILNQIKQISKASKIAYVEIKDRLIEFLSFFNNVETYAASLSLYSLSAIVPLIIIILSILLSVPNFQNEVEYLKNTILSNISPTNTSVISSYLDQFMENSKTLGMSAFIYVFGASILFFRNLENISSKLFESKKRTFFDAITVYWSLITLFPLGMGASLYFSLEVQTLIKSSNLLNLFDLLPYISIWIIFFILFKILANKPLPFLSLMLSSFITMIVWSLLKWAFVYYVFFNKAYTTIYGSFSILMFFILWIYCSWIVILYGMRLTQGLITNFGGKKDNNMMI
ncbi:MAG: YihY family inner membrane protein [Helicobacteraceae bacterium]|nr:YihY family inner membrane protein [Helicobacteraceae bacterium]